MLRTDGAPNVRRALLTIALSLMLIVPGAMAAQHAGGNETSGADGNESQAPGSQAGDQAGNETRGPDANQTRGRDRAPAQAQQARAEARAQAWENLPEQARAEAAQNAQRANLFSLFTYQAPTLDGRFVDVNYTTSNTSIGLDDYTVTNRNITATYFDSVTIDGLEGIEEPLAAGAAFHAFSNDTTVAIHDNPTAQLRVTTSANTTVTFDLAENLTLNDAGPALRFDHVSGLHFHLILPGAQENLTVSDDNSTITADMMANQTLMVLTHPVEQTVRASNIHERIEAIETGQFGGELSMVPAGDAVAEEASELGVNLTGVSLADERAEVEVSSEVDEGKTVIVSLPASALGNASAENLTITIDGQEIEVTDDVASVLEATGSQALAALEVKAGAVQATVYVPSFSVHTLMLAQSTSTDDSESSTDDGSMEDGSGNESAGDADDASGDQQAPFLGLVASLMAVVAVALVVRRD